MPLNSPQIIFAEVAQATQMDQRAANINMVFLVVVMIFVFYYVSIRPQNKRAKQHAALLKAVKSGDKVATSSGIIGVIISVKETTATLRSADSKLEISKASITEVLERSGQSSES